MGAKAISGEIVRMLYEQPEFEYVEATGLVSIRYVTDPVPALMPRAVFQQTIYAGMRFIRDLQEADKTCRENVVPLCIGCDKSGH